MTIAIGILASDGIVVGADTQHSWASLKISATKLISGSGIVITGSGDSFYIDAVGNLLRDYADANPGLTCLELGKRFGEILENFYEKKVIPFAKFKDRPDFELIIGVDRNGDRRLWTTNMATLTPSSAVFSVSGTGAPYVASPLAALLDPDITKPEKLTCSFAWKTLAYAVFLAKEHVEDCGKWTHISILKDGKAELVRETNINVLESCLAKSAGEQMLTVQYMLGYEYSDESDAQQLLLKKLESTRRFIKPLHYIVFSSSGEGLE